MTSLSCDVQKPASRRTLSVQSRADSPKESQPTTKKKLCRLTTGDYHTSTNNIRSVENEVRMSKPKRSVSILKKTAFRSNSASSSPEARRVQFKKHVTVFLMSEDGDIFCSECQNLSSDVENHVPTRGLVGDVTTPPVRVPFLPEDTHDSPQSDVDFRYLNDPKYGPLIKFVLTLGPEYKPEDIVVKANVTGSRIRLVANRLVAYPDGSMRIEQLSRRLTLPAEVDPYLVTARLDIKGNLTVEAPLSKDILSRQQTYTLQDISNKTALNTVLT